MTMTAPVQNVNHFKDALLRKRTEIDVLGRRPAVQAVMENDTRKGDVADQSSGNNEVHVKLTIKKTEAKILQAIEDALVRLNMGTYGVCRDCGEMIAEARLKAIPWARVCITCKEKASGNSDKQSSRRPENPGHSFPGDSSIKIRYA